jgi:RHS repeat-associated protein
LVSGGKAAGKAAEGIIAKAVKDLLRVGAKDGERAAARDALRAGERDVARRAERDAARAAERDASRSVERRALEGDPVDVASGAVVQHQVDVELPGLLPLVLTRTHLSSYRLGGWFGPTWASTLDQRLEVSAGGVRFLAADGSVLDYPAGVDQPAYGARQRLDRDRLTVTDRDRTLHFAQLVAGGVPSWPLTAITDRNGHRIDIDRDPAGVPVAVRHTGGYHIGVSTESGRITGYRIGEVDLIRYEYTEGQLTGVIDSSGLPLRFSYDEDGRLTGWQDRNGHWYRYRYDELGRCVAGDGAGGYLSATFSYADQLTVMTDALGNATAYHLDDAAQVVREVNPLGQATTSRWDAYDRLLSRTDPMGRTTRYRYDEDGNLLVLTRPDGSTINATYNRWGQPLLVTEPDGATWQRVYDDRGNLTAITDPAGATTTYGYTGRGHLSTVTDPLGNTTRVTTDAAGLPLTGTDPAGAVTAYQRDALGRVVAVVDPVGGTTRFGWTVEGRRAWQTYPDGGTAQWAYDPEGNLVAHRTAEGAVTACEVTGFDLLTARTGPDGDRFGYRYDELARLVEVTNPQGLSWRYEYDAAGNLIAETDFDGHRQAYEYDAAAQLVASTDRAGLVTTYQRDRLGNVLERRCGQVADTFGYDAAGRVVQAASPEVRLTISRDALGRVLAEDCNGDLTASRYDPLGRRVWRRTPSGAESWWDFDGMDRPTLLRAGGGSVRFGYDLAGREVARRVSDGALLTQTYDANHRLVTGRPAAALTPGGRVAAIGSERYEYDSAGNIARGIDGPHEYAGMAVRAAGRVRYERDGAGRMVARHQRTLSGQVRTWRYWWGPADRLLGVETPDGERWRYTYDPFGRRVGKQLLAPDGAGVVAEVRFAWDGLGLAEQATTAAVTTWDWAPGTFRVVAQTSRPAGGAPRFHTVVTDEVGTPTSLVDASGQVGWQRAATLWGVTGLPAGLDCPLQFPGQYRDDESALSYNYLRYYDPAAAQYATADPLGLEGGPHPYGYVPNPLRWSDPLGLAPYKLPEGYTSSPALRDDPWHPDSVARRSADQTAHYNDEMARAAQREVRQGRGPREIHRIDGPEESVPGSKWHAQKQGRGAPALNHDGTFHDGDPQFSRRTMDWLKQYGWVDPYA